jgi:regulator of cell morphogenesis and NO signaling
MNTTEIASGAGAEIDVTQIEPRLKHPTIFKNFDALQPGESFIIRNDHDPKPVYYQLLGERGNIFTFEYLEAGPEWWRIKIAKNKVDGKNEITVGDIAAKDYRKAEVFKKMGIDFCCGGKKSLKEASEEAGIALPELEKALREADTVSPAASMDYNKWDLDFLSDFIVNTHHRYIRDNAEIINNLAQKVAQRHGDSHPELKELALKVNHFLQDLLEHTLKEEEALFPNIKQLSAHQKNPAKYPAIPGGISVAIKTMQAEHDLAGADLHFFRKATKDYALPTDACNSYQYLFEKMKEFEEDTFRHIHLENNILFPKAVQLEREMDQ